MRFPMEQRVLLFFRRYLGRKGTIYTLALLTTLLMAPSLWSGLSTDDYFVRWVITQPNHDLPFDRTPMGIFSFGNGNEAERLAAIDQGVYPWWVPPHTRLAFSRPLATLSHVLDYALFPDSPFLMHLHNLLWYVALAAAVTLFYRRMIHPAWVGGLAALLFVADDAHSFAVGWLACRNSMMAAAFAVLVLYAHDRWRRDGRTVFLGLGLLALALGLACGESSVAVCGYLGAYAFCLERSSWRSRIASLVPYAAMVLVWLAIYHSSGYGSTGSGSYLDPIREPKEYLTQGLQRLPILLLAQLATPSASLWPFYPEWLAYVQTGIAVAFVAFVGWTLWPMLRHDRAARFWALGMILATLPVCATFPNDRLLFFTGLGGMGLVAEFLGACVARPAWMTDAPRPVSTRLLAICWIAIHCVFSPIWSPFSSVSPAVVSAAARVGCAPIYDTADLGRQDIVLINAPSDFLIFYAPTFRAAKNEPLPRHMWTLSAGIEPVVVLRENADTLVVRPRKGFFERGWSKMLRGPSYPFRAGETVDNAGFTAEIREADVDGIPLAVAFRFKKPLDDPQYRFLAWVKDAYQPFVLPAVGEETTLPAVPWGWFAGNVQFDTETGKK